MEVEMFILCLASLISGTLGQQFGFATNPGGIMSLFDSVKLDSKFFSLNTAQNKDEVGSKFFSLNTAQNKDEMDARRYINLFQPIKAIKNLRNSRAIGDNYVVTSYIDRQILDPVCGETRNGYSSAYVLPSCPNENAFLVQSTFSVRGTCCTTSMFLTVPNTVQSIIDGQTYPVKHLSSSYQVIHEGSCQSPGTECGTAGNCRVASRVQWVLVEIGSAETFVPVNIPNHCYCSN